LRTKGFNKEELKDLFRICRDSELHCIYEVSANQVYAAQKLAGPLGIAVRTAPAEHLHVDAKLQSASPGFPASIVPDFWAYRNVEVLPKSLSEMAGPPGSDIATWSVTKWFHGGPSTWIEWQPPAVKARPPRPAVRTIWKEKGTRTIEGIDYTKLESLSDKHEVKTCYLPTTLSVDGKLLANWHDEKGSAGIEKAPIGFPSDDGNDSVVDDTSELRKYSVVSGDTIRKICEHFHMSMSQFMEINPKLYPTRLMVNQVVNVWERSGSRPN